MKPGRLMIQNMVKAVTARSALNTADCSLCRVNILFRDVWVEAAVMMQRYRIIACINSPIMKNIRCGFLFSLYHIQNAVCITQNNLQQNFNVDVLLSCKYSIENRTESLYNIGD